MMKLERRLLTHTLAAACVTLAACGRESGDTGSSGSPVAGATAGWASPAGIGAISGMGGVAEPLGGSGGFGNAGVGGPGTGGSEGHRLVVESRVRQPHHGSAERDREQVARRRPVTGAALDCRLQLA